MNEGRNNKRTLGLLMKKTVDGGAVQLVEHWVNSFGECGR